MADQLAFCKHPRGIRAGHIRRCVDCREQLEAKCSHCGKRRKLLPDGNLWNHGTLAAVCPGSLSFRHDAPDAVAAMALVNKGRAREGLPLHTRTGGKIAGLW